VNVGIIGKIFGLGTINIDTGMVTYSKNGNGQIQYEKLSLVSEPYKVLQVIQANLLARPK
jgi:hypothetical protein